jgi:hypothetical protein
LLHAFVVSVLGIYTTSIMLMNTLSVMLTVFVLNIHHRSPDRPIPPWIRTVVFGGMSRLFCMYEKPESPMFAEATSPNNHCNEEADTHKNVSFDFLPNNHKNHEHTYVPSKQRVSDLCELKKRAIMQQQNNKRRKSQIVFYKDMAGLDVINIDDPHEWKRLAKVIDRFFFWMTFVALLSISLCVFCMLATS